MKISVVVILYGEHAPYKSFTKLHHKTNAPIYLDTTYKSHILLWLYSFE